MFMKLMLHDVIDKSMLHNLIATYYTETNEIGRYFVGFALSLFLWIEVTQAFFQSYGRTQRLLEQVAS